MATTFQLKRSSVAGKVPNTSTLSIGELGLNLTDQILYSSNGTGVFEIGANVTNQTIKTSLLVGNSSVNTTVNSTSVSIGANNLTVGTSLYAVSNGNVGIGTSSPTNQLQVTGIIKATSRLYVGSTSDDLYSGGIINLSNSTRSIGINVDPTNSGTNSILNFSIDGSELMRLTSTGRLGIGTTSPGFRLHVGESSGIAIYGSSSTNHGVYGISNSAIGVFGQSSSSQGVYGSSSTGTGIYGLSTSNYGAYSQSTNNYGIYGRTLNSGFGGIIGYNHDASKYAILGFSTNYAVYGAGDAYFSGALSKGSGSFNIPHPLPELSETHRLVHSFVEAPTADNIYRGRLQLANGQATINIDTHVGITEGTFSALNGNIQVFLQNESGWDFVRGSVTDNILTIISQNQSSTDTISWMVIGERQDQHMLDTQWTDEFGRPILEPLKEPEPDVALPPEPEVPNENG